MKAGEALAVGFRQTHQAWAVIALGWIPSVVTAVLEKLFGSEPGQTPNLVGSLTMISGALLAAVLWCLWSVGLLGWARDRLSETPPSWERFWESAFKFFWRFLLLLILEMGMFLGAFLAAGIISAVFSRLFPVISVLVVLLAIVATSLLMLLVTYSGVSLVQRDLGAVASIKDSVRFARGNFWGTAWLLFLISLVWIGLSLVVLAPAAGFLISQMGFQEGLKALSKGGGALSVGLLTGAVNAYGWVLCTFATYAYYLGNQPAPATEESS